MLMHTKNYFLFASLVAFAAGLGACATGGATAACQPVSAQKAADTEAPAVQASQPTEEPAESAGDSELPEDAAMAVPSTCANDPTNQMCMPPRSFVEKACQRPFSPETALVMFQKDTPWTRVYINRDLDAWYAGAHSIKSKVALDEEVIVLSHSASHSGIKVGSGGYDVIRWNGDCISVNPEEVSLKLPRKPARASVPWKLLDAKVRDALLADADVAAAESARRKLCKEDMLRGTTSVKCTKATDALSASVADAISKGRVSVAPSQGTAGSENP